MSAAAVARARALIGVRFRPQGRSAALGLDCVGLVVVAHDLPGDAIRRDYALRGVERAAVEAGLAPWFRRVARTQAAPGDVVLIEVAAGVLHLGIASGDGVIHADVRYGVVERPGVMAWPILAVFRRRTGGGRG